MNNDNPKPVRKCNQCGSDLIIQESKIETTEGNSFPVTVTTYICSDPSCQEEIDKRTAKRIQLKQEQELARQKRFEFLVKKPKNP